MKNKLQQTLNKLETLSQFWIIGLSLILLFIITFVDYSIKIDLGISIFIYFLFY